MRWVVLSRSSPTPDPPDETPADRYETAGYAGWPGNPRTRAVVDSSLLCLAAATVAACLLEPPGTLRLLLVLASACVVPGGALLTRLPLEDPVEALGLSVALGLMVEAAGTLVMVWTGFWQPVAWAAVLLGASCSAIGWDLYRSRAVDGQA